MSGNRIAILRDIGVRVWLPRKRARAARPAPADAPRIAAAEPVAAIAPVAAGADPARLDWRDLEHQASRCTACDLHRGRTQAVFGTGDRSARWMVIGEAPGAEEDRRGEPFVGRAGQLLNAMLLAAGFKREEVYIANVVKCRPPDNRDPRPEEAACCAPFLQRQIQLVAPQLILAVGRVAAQRLLLTDTPVGKLRGKLHRLGTSPAIALVVTYHPAYLLRSPKEKAKVWQDLRFALEQGRAAP